MSGWGNTYVKFYEPKTLQERSTAPLFAKTGYSHARVSRVGGQNKITINLDQLTKLDPAYPTILYDDIAMAWTTEQTGPPGNRYVAAVKIKSIQTNTTSSGISVMELTGPDELAELSDFLHFFAIGSTFQTTTKYSLQLDDDTLWLTTVADVESEIQQTCHGGEDVIQVDLADFDKFAPGDEICFALQEEDDPVPSTKRRGSHRTRVKEVALSEDEVYTSLTMEDGVPVGLEAKSADGSVYIPRISYGDTIRIRLSDNITWHTAHVINEPFVDDVEIYPPIPEALNALREVELITGEEPKLTDDIADVMRPATDEGWTLITGTSSTGSSYRPDGANISSMLMDTASKSGDYFRLVRDTMFAPSNKLEWRLTSPTSGILLVMPDQVNAQVQYLNEAYGVIQSFKDMGETVLVSKVSAIIGSDPTIYMDMADTIDPAFPLVYENGAWVVHNKALSAQYDGIYNVHRYLTLADIVPVSDSEAEKKVAAQKGYDACVTYLQNNIANVHYYKASCVIHGEVYPGDSVNVNYSEPYWTFVDSVYISEMKITKGNRKKGVRIHDFILSDKSPRELVTATQALMGAFEGGGGTTSVGSGGNGGGGGTYTAGDNLLLSTNEFSLDPSVEIRHSLWITETAEFYMWDDVTGRYVRLYIRHSGGIPYLVIDDDQNIDPRPPIQASSGYNQIMGPESMSEE